jgi:hypothetical protein
MRRILFFCSITLAMATPIAVGTNARPEAAPQRDERAAQAGTLGYYRFPALHGDTLVFTAEGDLWQVPIDGGVAQRLTSHPSEESRAAFSPDG